MHVHSHYYHVRSVGHCDHSVEVARRPSWVIKHLTLYLNNTNINKSNSLIRCLYFYQKKWLTLIDLWVEQRRWTPGNRRGTSRLKKTNRTKAVKTDICASKTHYDVKHFNGENMESNQKKQSRVHVGVRLVFLTNSTSRQKRLNLSIAPLAR